MKEIYENCCLPIDNAEINLVAKDRGIKVLTSISSVVRELLDYLGMPYADKAVKDGDAEYIEDKIVNIKDLTDSEKAR